MADKRGVKNTLQSAAKKVGDYTNQVVGAAVDNTIAAAHGASELAGNAKKAIIKAVDQNHDGQIGIEDMIALGIRVPGVHISRDKYLRKELFKNHPQEVIEKAIAATPAQAGIPASEIDKIADEAIKYERAFVSGISAALGAPGGWAMAATLPVDLGQYYAYTLRAIQKLLYLYGFPELASDEEGLVLDSETLNAIILCLGVMNGVAGASNAIKAMAKALGAGVEKKLLNMALTKGAVYPLVKGIMRWFNVNLTKKIFSGAVGKAIPVVGGMVGGGITFFSFKPCCDRLKAALQDTMLSNPQHIATKEELATYHSIITGEVIDVDAIDVVDDNSSIPPQDTSESDS